MLNLSVKRIWLMVALFALVTATGASTAWQLAGPDRSLQSGALIAQDQEPDPDEICPPGERECSFEDEENQQEGEGNSEGGGNSGGGTCTWTGPPRDVLPAAAAQEETIEIPCYHPGWGWYGGDSCYYGEFPAMAEVPAPPEGKTEEDGRYYWASCFWSIEQFNGQWIMNPAPAVAQWRWFDFEDVPTLSPEELALRALATVTLDPVEFQLSPPETGAGLVGLPVWLGIADTPNTLGPITSEPQCDGDLCVEITAEVTEVAWEMGDGTPAFPCQPDEHVTWQPGMDFLTPDDCHHYYHRSSRGQPDGKYEITATSTWSVSYTSTSGIADTLPPVPRTATTSLQIDEIQVLTG